MNRPRKGFENFRVDEAGSATEIGKVKSTLRRGDNTLKQLTKKKPGNGHFIPPQTPYWLLQKAGKNKKELTYPKKVE